MDIRQFNFGTDEFEFLTQEEQLPLIVRAQAGDDARRKLRSADLPDDERSRLLLIVRSGEEAVGQLLQSIGPRIMQMAKKWYFRTSSHWELDDCIMHGTMGAMRAIQKFDVNCGLKLITYATWWIWQGLGRMKTTGDVIYRPIHVKGWSTTQSLDIPVGETGSESRVSLLAPDGDDGDTVLREVEKRETADRVQLLMKCLPDRERQIMQLRMTFTLEEVGDKLGVSRERIRQIEKRALRRLKSRADYLGMTDDSGRERQTRRSYECPKCKGQNTRLMGRSHKRWKCDDCRHDFIPEEFKFKPAEKPAKATMEVTPSRRSSDDKTVYQRRPVDLMSIDIPTDKEEPRTVSNQHERVEQLLREGIPARQIHRETGISVPSIKKIANQLEEREGELKCKCGRPRTHVGRCEFRRVGESKLSGDAGTPKTPKAKPKPVPTQVIRVQKSTEQSPKNAGDLLSEADRLDREADNLRSKAALLREAARLVDRANSLLTEA